MKANKTMLSYLWWSWTRARSWLICRKKRCSLGFSGMKCVPDLSSRWRQQTRTCFLSVVVWRRWETYVILLSLEFLTEVKLLSLECHQPLPQLVGLLPASRHSMFQKSNCLNGRQNSLLSQHTLACLHPCGQHSAPSCAQPRSSSSSPFPSAS